MSTIRNLRNRKVVYILFFPFFMNISGLMVESILVLHALDLGSTLLEISLMTLVGSAMGIALRIPFGILSDRLGRKPMLLFPDMMAALADLSRALATEPWHLILASLVGGLGGEYSVNLFSLVSDVAEPAEVPSCLSTLFFCSSIGMILGPSIASGLLMFTSIRNILYVSFFARLGLLVYTQYFIKEPKRINKERIDYVKSAVSLLKKRNMVAAMAMSLFFFVMNAIGITFVPIYARRELGLSNSQVASLPTFRSIAIMMIRLFSNEIIGRTGYKKLVLLMLTISGLVGFAYPFSTDYASLSVLSFIFGSTFGSLTLSGAVLVSTVTDETNRGIANAIYSLANSSGTLTPAMMTPIAEMYGLPAVFNVGAVIPVIGTLVVAYLMKEPFRKA